MKAKAHLFESHITVKNISLENLLSICAQHYLKPVNIVNDSGSNNVPQLMTAQFHKCKNIKDALGYMNNISDKFPANNVLRRKLELIMWPKQGKYSDADQETEIKYFEFHSKFQIEPKGPLDSFARFKYIVLSLGGHVSQNTLKGGFALQ